MEFDLKRAAEWKLLLRYYQAGLVNLVFGYGLFAFFNWAGMNMYAAQIVSHVIGMAFNYLTYSRYTFVGHRANQLRFILSYVLIYIWGLVSLLIAAHFVASPYIAGIFSIAFISVMNYFVLKRLVFIKIVPSPL